ncbi:hypothetical protein ACP0CQ_00115 [Metamycoplasma hominis]|uniref:hypothetical protein n=1 Tax=Metamycoplasma hominis TaxID=2098 RepID=UPI003CF868AF
MNKKKQTLKEMLKEQLEYISLLIFFYEEILKCNNSKNLKEVVEKNKKRHNFSISIKQIITILGIKNLLSIKN